MTSSDFDFDRYDRVRPIRWTGDALELLDQRRLPFEVGYIRCESYEAVADAIRAASGNAQAVAFDVTDREQLLAAINRFEADIGAIDILVNNAGIQRRAPLEDFSASDWHDVMRTNLDGVFHVSQAVARHKLTIDDFNLSCHDFGDQGFLGFFKFGYQLLFLGDDRVKLGCLDVEEVGDFALFN